MSHDDDDDDDDDDGSLPGIDLKTSSRAPGVFAAGLFVRCE